MIIGFFEALFGSLYIGGRLLGEKALNAGDKARHEKYEKIEEIITNRSREAELDNSIYHHKKTTLQVAEMVPEEDLIYVFGQNYKELMSAYINRLQEDYSMYNGFYDITSILVNIILSQEGIARSYRLIRGYNWCSPVLGLSRDNKDEVCKRALRIIDRNMRRAHPDLEIYLCQAPGSGFEAQHTYDWSVALMAADIKKPPVFGS